MFNAFQFHIVRLKVASQRTQRHGNAFQFHIVRLKVGIIEWYARNYCIFQFHIVRLKAIHSRYFGTSP